jgi:hypothetical protein
VTYNAIHYAKEYGIDNRKGMKGFYQTLRKSSCLRATRSHR